MPDPPRVPGGSARGLTADASNDAGPTAGQPHDPKPTHLTYARMSP